MQPLTATAAPPAEDIEDVLGRFNAWTKAHKTNEFVDGVRELSYEEALASTRRRWQSHKPTSPLSTPTEKAAAGASIEDDSLALDKLTLSTAEASSPSDPTSAGETLPASFETVLTEAVSPDINSGPLALVWPVAGKSERQVSMSFRVAASEQALIKARAAEAGLSLSAYVRQCTLEVERLRTQVHHTLALIEQGQTPVRSLGAGSEPLPPRGFLARLRQRIFGPARSLTLRA